MGIIVNSGKSGRKATERDVARLAAKAHNAKSSKVIKEDVDVEKCPEGVDESECCPEGVDETKTVVEEEVEAPIEIALPKPSTKKSSTPKKRKVATKKD